MNAVPYNSSVVSKLRSIVEMIVHIRMMRKRPYYWGHTLFTTTSVVLGALSGVGITAPLLDVLRGEPGPNEPSAAAATGVFGALDTYAAYPPAVVLAVFVGTILWVVARAIFVHNAGEAKAVLAKHTLKTVDSLQVELMAALGKANPIPDLNTLLEQKLNPAVQVMVQEGAFTTDLLQRNEKVDRRSAELVENLCGKFGQNWEAEPQIQQR